jgi:hypothetical protein
MIEVNAYVENPGIYGGTSGGEIFPGIKERVTLPKHLLIMHPSSSTYEILIQELKGKNRDGVGGIPRYKHVGKVLIPWQFLRMPEVWVNFEKSSHSSWH